MITAETDVETFLNYEPKATNGGGQPFFPGTASIYLRDRDQANVVVSDIRDRESEFSLEHHGFEFHKHASTEKDFTSDERVKSAVYDETIELLKKKYAAFPLDWLV